MKHIDTGQDQILDVSEGSTVCQDTVIVEYTPRRIGK